MSTDDPDEADVHLRAYARYRAEPTAREGFEFALEAVSAGSFAVDTLRHTARFRAEADPPETLMVTEALHGAIWVTCGGEVTTGDLVLVPGRSTFRCGWDDARIRMTTFDRPAVIRAAAGIAGCEPGELTFDAVNPRSADLARYWRRLTDHVERDLLTDDAAMASPVLRGEVLRSLAAGLLVVFPSTLDRRLPAGPDAGGPATVRRAVAFMDGHAREDIDITAIAEAAGLGARGLQAAFRRHRGQAPLEYLRRVRMEGAHRDLQAGDPTRGDSVAVIAAAWGFAQPGRFAVEYRRTFGCVPSETLRT